VCSSLSCDEPSWMSEDLEIAVMTPCSQGHLGSYYLCFGPVTCSFRTPTKRAELSKFPFDIFFYNCCDISICKFLLLLKVGWKSEFLGELTWLAAQGLMLSLFNWRALHPVSVHQRGGQVNELCVPNAILPGRCCCLPSFC
jgi:hypothetical protein